MSEKFSRGEFLRRFLGARAQKENSDPAEPDYLSMLPPDFTDQMLRQEIIRQGHDPGKLSKNQMAGVILGKMSAWAKNFDDKDDNKDSPEAMD